MNCTACGYDLSAHESGARCPECGLEVDLTLWAEFERADEATPHRIGTLVISGFWMFCAGAALAVTMFALWASEVIAWYMVLVSTAAASFLGGALSGVLWRRYLYIWASVFAWPIVILCAIGIVVLPGVLARLLWIGAAACAVVAAIGGARAGKWLVRVRVPD